MNDLAKEFRRLAEEDERGVPALLVHVEARHPSRGGRRRAIFSGYRAPWAVSNLDDERRSYHDAVLILLGKERIEIGGESYGYLIPASPEPWTHLTVGDELRAHEGQKVVATARVVGTIPVSDRYDEKQLAKGTEQISNGEGLNPDEVRTRLGRPTKER